MTQAKTQWVKTPLDWTRDEIYERVPILPRVIADRVACEQMPETVPHEIYERRLVAFANFAEKVFCRHFNTSLHFRKTIDRLHDQDDMLRLIYPWFDMWWHAYNHRILRKKLTHNRKREEARKVPFRLLP